MSYILCKTKHIGTKSKTVDLSVTGDLILLDIQQGKAGMKLIRYHLELGATASCTKRLMEETKGFGQRALKG